MQPSVHLSNYRNGDHGSNQVEIENSPEQVNESSVTYECGICESTFESEFKLIHHMNQVHEYSDNIQYQCSLCQRCFRTKSILLRHMSKHLVENLDTDSAAVEQDKFLSNNLKSHFKCDFCCKVLSNRFSMVRHLKMHVDKRSAMCDICGKAFRLECDVKRHINEVHLRLAKYPCEFCNKAFTTKNVRDSHQRIHTGERPFHCQMCQKTFKSLSQLGVHKRIHSDKKPFQCKYCDMAFKFKQRLISHEYIHTGNRPFQCDICGKAFRA